MQTENFSPSGLFIGQFGWKEKLEDTAMQGDFQSMYQNGKIYLGNQDSFLKKSLSLHLQGLKHSF